MKASDDLFRLVKSLQPTEKRYFKLFSSLHKGDKNYIKLFDAIDKQKIYDEEKIKKIHSKSPFIKHLPWEKNNLYKLILKSLRTYHSGKSVDSELMDLIRDAEILLKKSLNDQSKKLLVKARKISSAYEQNFLVPLITRLEFRMHDPRTLQQSLEEDGYIFENLKNTNEYKKILINLVVISVKKNQARDTKDITVLNKIMRSPLLTNEDKALTFESKLYMYQAYMLFFELQLKPHKAYAYRKKTVALLEDNPLQTELFPLGYLIALNNLCIGQIQLKKFKEIPQSLQKIKDLSGKLIPEEMRIKIFIYSSQIESDLYIHTGEFKKGAGLIKGIESGLEEFSGKIQVQFLTVLYFNIAYLYFGIEEYGKCIKWLNKLFSETAATREDIQSAGRIFYLIAHFESDNNYPLEPIIKSTYRYLYKKKRLYRFETIALNYIKKLSKVNRKNVSVIFKELERELMILDRSPFEREVIRSYFDFISWLESKIEKKNFAEIVKEKIKS